MIGKVLLGYLAVVGGIGASIFIVLIGYHAIVDAIREREYWFLGVLAFLSSLLVSVILAAFGI